MVDNHNTRCKNKLMARIDTILNIAARLAQTIPLENFFPPHNKYERLEKLSQALPSEEKQVEKTPTPDKIPPSSPSKIAESQPPTGSVGSESHEAGSPPILAPDSQESPYITKEQKEDEIMGGTAGNLCSDEHLTQAASDLDEALRMARSRGTKDNEVRKRLKGARSELNQLERYDLVPSKVQAYPKEQQEIARWLLPNSASLRHQINDVLLRDREIEDLENLTATGDNISSELTDRIDKLPKEQRETDACAIYTERAKPISKTSLPPEIEALKQMVEERKGLRG